ncbi:MAG: biotin/lipoyl-containing protein, partial [Bdellovibrio sp.]
MIYEIKMPSLGADMDKGRFIEWKVKVGDHVDKDQEIAIIETPKAAVEVDSFRSGKIVEIVAKPDDVYPVGAVLAKMELDFVEEES